MTWNKKANKNRKDLTGITLKVNTCTIFWPVNR